MVEMFSTKFAHSFRVGLYCREIAKSIGWSDAEADAAAVVGYLHDAGSFVEMVETGRWEHAGDHGALGHELLLRVGVERVFGTGSGGVGGSGSGGGYKAALEAVRYHNRSHCVNPSNPYLTILRDADKLEIMEFICSLWVDGELGDYCTTFFNPAASAKALCAGMLPWVDEIYYDWTLQRMRRFGLIDTLRHIAEECE
jgi:hypothetical protein